MLLLEETSGIPLTKEIVIKYSPVVEMVASLHALSAPELHPNRSRWTKDTLASMDTDLRDELLFFSDHTMNWAFIMDLVGYIEQGEVTSMKAFLAHLANMSDVDFCYGIFSGLVPRRTLAHSITSTDHLLEQNSEIFRYYVPEKFARYILDNLEEYRHRLVSVLDRYWHEHFADIWNTIGVSEISALATERKLLELDGPAQYIENCHEQVHVDRTGIRVGRQLELFYRNDEIKRINVIITSFLTPHFMINCIDGCLTIFKGVTFGQATAEIPPEIELFLKAIGSPMKLKILAELNVSPKTTKELADILQVAPSSISVHLRAMRDADLVYPQRMKNEVYYNLLYENYQAHLSFLEHLLDTP